MKRVLDLLKRAAATLDERLNGKPHVELRMLNGAVLEFRLEADFVHVSLLATEKGETPAEYYLLGIGNVGTMYRVGSINLKGIRVDTLGQIVENP
jgi:hypothetical protein